MRTITQQDIERYIKHLRNEEKADATVKKYVRDIMKFCKWIGDREVNKERVLEYKDFIIVEYQPASVNSVISSLNSFFNFAEWYDCKIRILKLQRRIFAETGSELNKSEYERLLSTAHAQKKKRLCLAMQTLCSTGIRVSELKFITVEALKKGMANIRCKGKLRQVLLTDALCQTLTTYAQGQKITSGPVFVTRTGKPLDRSNIWRDMKKLCKTANVSSQKVFPHNLRHLFARTFYALRKDIVRLADILGHSSINTTRIYTMETGEEHRSLLDKLDLLLDDTT